MTRFTAAFVINDWKDAIDSDCSLAEHPNALLNELQAALLDRLEFPEHMESTFKDALRCLLSHPGSMVRPRIVCQIALAYDMPKARAIDLAIALEYFHCASLVFDDLPCMDNATMRRGAQCIHLTFGQSTAILSALALINRAYALTWEAVSSRPEGIRQPALRYIEQRLGVFGLLNGQSLDLGYSRLPHTLRTANEVAQGKTVSLIALTLVLPAMLGAASKRELQLLDRISKCWGLAYQAIDDLKDVLQNSDVTGKTVARDYILDRPNVALVIGIPAAVERLASLLRLGDRALERLITIQPSLNFLREFRFSLKDELSRVFESAGAIPIDKRR